MILTMNNIFTDNHYLQMHGTATSTKMTPSFANLFLGVFFEGTLGKASCLPHIWLHRWEVYDLVRMSKSSIILTAFT